MEPEEVSVVCILVRSVWMVVVAVVAVVVHFATLILYDVRSLNDVMTILIQRLPLTDVIDVSRIVRLDAGVLVGSFVDAFAEHYWLIK